MNWQKRDEMHKELDEAKSIISAIHQTASIITALEKGELISSLGIQGSTKFVKDLLIPSTEFSKSIKYSLIGYLQDHKAALEEELNKRIQIKGYNIDLKA